ENMGDYSEEQGELFHQDIMDLDVVTKDKENIMGYNIWGFFEKVICNTFVNQEHLQIYEHFNIF
ncbi:Uncharacterized protein FKW44_013840, partial [Caligus rogercresseyi]